MANQYRNWTSEAAFLRKHANRIRKIALGCDDDQSCDELIKEAEALEARANNLTLKQKDKVNG